MRRLTLMRHAKASPAGPGENDHDRALAVRGEAAALAVGAATAARPPELVLCSTAQRTRGTLRHLERGWQVSPATIFDERLYLTEAPILLERIAATGAAVADLWLIGHNPGLHELARHVATGAGGKSMPHLDDGFPTSSWIAFECDAERWDLILARPRRVVAFNLRG